MCILSSLSPRWALRRTSLRPGHILVSSPGNQSQTSGQGTFRKPDTGQFSDASLEHSVGGWGTRGWRWAQGTPTCRCSQEGSPKGPWRGGGGIEEMARRFLFNQIPLAQPLEDWSPGLSHCFPTSLPRRVGTGREGSRGRSLMDRHPI